MKKLALFAMLLGSTFVFGCEKPAEKKDPPAEPAAGAPDATKEGEAAKPADEKPADETVTPPAEPAK